MNTIQFLIESIKPTLTAHGYKSWSLKRSKTKGMYELLLRCEDENGFVIKIFEEKKFDKVKFEEIAGMGWVNCGKIELMIFEKGVEK